MEETQKIMETNYKDKYIKKLEEQNKMLLELIQKLIFSIISIVLLFCLLIGFISYQYFNDDFYNTSITGDSNSTISSSELNDSDLDIQK